MMPRLGLCAFFFLANWALATDPLPLPSDRLTVELAAPPLEGTVSIGVFDATGKCVRILFKNTDFRKVPAALNGFSIVWDGKNERGEIVPKGTYEMHGVTVGNVKIEGVAYHFNDWIDPEKKAAVPLRTLQIRLLPDLSFLVVQTLSSGETALRRYTKDGKIAWSQPLSTSPDGFTIDSDHAWIALNGEIISFNLETGASEKWPETFPKSTLLALSDAGLLLVAEDTLSLLDRTSHQAKPVAKLPSASRLLTARGNLVLASDGATVFRLNGDHFDKMEPSQTAGIRDLVAGKNNEFWVVGFENSLAEFDLQGQSLRNLEPEKGEEFQQISASPDDSSIALLNQKKPGTIMKILERTAAPSGEVSLWKTKIQKEIQPTATFAIDPQTLAVIPQGNLPEHRAVTISLVQNELSPGVAHQISLNPTSLEGGLWIATEDGLPLFPVISEAKSERMILLRGRKKDELRLFAAIDGAIAEFSLRGVAEMMQFGGDHFAWPPGPRQAADEQNIPEKSPAPTP